MRGGKLLLIDIGAVSPNLVVNTTDNWPASDLWNFKKWDLCEIHHKIVKEEENHDLGKTTALKKLEGFAMGIMINDEVTYNKLVEAMPAAADFKKI